MQWIDLLIKGIFLFVVLLHCCDTLICTPKWFHNDIKHKYSVLTIISFKTQETYYYCFPKKFWSKCLIIFDFLGKALQSNLIPADNLVFGDLQWFYFSACRSVLHNCSLCIIPPEMSLTGSKTSKIHKERTTSK